jgi:hypothetical protein
MARGLTALAAVAALVLAAPAAHAATGSPPVTHPDEVTLHAGEGVMIDAADNDGDPDGDALQVCRIGPDVPRVLSHSFVEDGDLVVVASRRARGTYTLTYYVCDSSYLTPGTVTVHVKPPAPGLEVIPIGDAPPGRLRIKNTFKHRTFHCTWGPLGEKLTEGKTTVRPRSSVVIRVHEANVDIECQSGGMSYGFGFVAGRAPVAYRTDRVRAG